MIIAELPIRINLNVQQDQIAYSFDINNTNEQIDFSTDTEIHVEIVASEEYTGPYLVTPQAYENQILQTKDKTCTDDVTVLKVPKYETSNLAGGKTVYIAEGDL